MTEFSSPIAQKSSGVRNRRVKRHRRRQAATMPCFLASSKSATRIPALESSRVFRCRSMGSSSDSWERILY